MNPISSISTPTISTNPDHQKLVETAQAFEAIFLRDMIESMRAGGMGPDLLGNDAGIQFRDMMDQKLADDMAGNSGGFGIAEMLVQEWQKRL